MQEIRNFLENYRLTWQEVMNGSREVDSLTSFFHIPCLMIGIDGSMTQYVNEKDILTFNKSRLDSFKEGGATTANFRGVDTLTQGPYLSASIVNWELTKNDGELERCWRHYYTIRYFEDECKILVSTFQTGS